MATAEIDPKTDPTMTAVVVEWPECRTATLGWLKPVDAVPVAGAVGIVCDIDVPVNNVVEAGTKFKGLVGAEVVTTGCVEELEVAKLVKDWVKRKGLFAGTVIEEVVPYW